MGNLMKNVCWGLFDMATLPAATVLFVVTNENRAEEILDDLSTRVSAVHAEAREGISKLGQKYDDFIKRDKCSECEGCCESEQTDPDFVQGEDID